MDEIPANLVAAHLRLIERLAIIRAHKTSGPSDWEALTLLAFKAYLEETGVESSLIWPLMEMFAVTWEEKNKARRREEGRSGTPAPAKQTLPMEFAAAAVTVLKRQRKGKIEDLLTSVARAAGIDRKALKSFRDNINRGLLARSSESYKGYVQQIEAEGWRPAQIMKSLATLRASGFVS